MLFDAESGGFPPIDVVALRTFTLLWARVKLAFMRIGGMAIVAIGKGNFLLKVVLNMACGAGYRCVFAEEGVFGLGVVEIVARQHGFPTARRMARVASLFELAAMWIEVAVRARREFHVLISDGTPGGVRLVALIARDFDV